MISDLRSNNLPLLSNSSLFLQPNYTKSLHKYVATLPSSMNISSVLPEKSPRRPLHPQCLVRRCCAATFSAIYPETCGGFLGRGRDGRGREEWVDICQVFCRALSSKFSMTCWFLITTILIGCIRYSTGISSTAFTSSATQQSSGARGERSSHARLWHQMHLSSHGPQSGMV